MGYQIIIKKNIILNSSEVQLSSEVNKILCDLSDTVTVSKTVFSLDGWNIAEEFDSYRPGGTNEISRESLIDFIAAIQDQLSLSDDIKNQIYFTFYESY